MKKNVVFKAGSFTAKHAGCELCVRQDDDRWIADVCSRSPYTRVYVTANNRQQAEMAAVIFAEATEKVRGLK